MSAKIEDQYKKFQAFAATKAIPRDARDLPTAQASATPGIGQKYTQLTLPQKIKRKPGDRGQAEPRAKPGDRGQDEAAEAIACSGDSGDDSEDLSEWIRPGLAPASGPAPRLGQAKASAPIPIPRPQPARTTQAVDLGRSIFRPC
jgi:hypothetical protein